MAQNLVIIAAGPGGSVPQRENRRSQRTSELWRIAGAPSIAGDTGVFTPNYINVVQDVIGPYLWSQSAGVVTLTALATQSASQFGTVEVLGFE